MKVDAPLLVKFKERQRIKFSPSQRIKFSPSQRIKFRPSQRDRLRQGVLSALLALPLVSVSISASGQQTYNQNSNDQRHYGQEPYISVFEDCDYRGHRRDVSLGDFRTMKEFGFGNDKMSSIQVSRELEVVIYQHDQFKGDYARVDQDVRCFDNKWNDEVSSMKVQYRPSQPVEPTRNTPNKPLFQRDGVTGNNVSYIAFDQRELKQVDVRTWQLSDRRRGAVNYTEVGRDNNVVNLQNPYTSERIRIDLYVNDVTVVGPQGQRRFGIDDRKASTRALNMPVEPDTRIQSRCFDYKVYTNGLPGGIRFSNGKDFYRFNDRPHQGQICHSGELVVEINKRDFDTDVTLEILGRQFKFASGEKETQYRASWYRKVIKLQVGR